MCRTQYVVALVALYVGSAHSLSWDYVVTTSTALEFYNNISLTQSEDFEFGIKYLTYDAVQNRLLFLLDEENSENIFLHSLNLATMERQSIFMIKLNKENVKIHSLAYDPFTEIVYFVHSQSIFWFSLKPGFKNNFTGNLLVSSNTSFSGIAVDSIRGYIYCRDVWEYTIQRARLNDSLMEFETVLSYSGKYFTIDEQTKKLYWVEERPYHHGSVLFSIKSSDLNGENPKELYSERISQYSSTQALTVSKDFIYWMDGENMVWKLQKNGDVNSSKIYTNDFLRSHYSIVANYKIEDQTQSKLISKSSVSNENSLNVPTDESLVCHNYCIQGNCSVIEGQAMCRCNAGYSGDRCAVNICQGYCLNDGDCYFNGENERVCQCKGDYRGERCAVPVFLMKCFQTVSLLKDILNADLTSFTLDYGVKSTCTK